MKIPPAAEIRDPIHGYVYLTEMERELIDTPVFQRLRRIRQLAGAHLTYPGAQHSRFEHSVGVLYLAQRAASVLSEKGYLNDEDAGVLVLGALLHDVGHGPFSHLLEEVMSEKRNVTHEDMTEIMIKQTELKDVIRKHGFREDPIARLALGMSEDHPPFVNGIVGGGLSVDIMDYLLRDSYFAGVEYGKVDVHRIINSFEVSDSNLALDGAALYAFEALMIARYEMFRAVYFHRTVRAAEIMIVKAMELADDYLGITDVKDIKSYLSKTDELVLEKLVNLPGSDKALEQARRLAHDYMNRKLLKCVFERLIHRKDKFMERIFSQKRIRDEIARQIADGAKVSEQDVFIDVPTAPSVPLSATRETLDSITLVSRTGGRRSGKVMKVSELPLAGPISGFFDILRVYTTQNNREKVEEATAKFFGRGGFTTKVSM